MGVLGTLPIFAGSSRFVEGLSFRHVLAGPFPLSRRGIKRTYKEHSGKALGHNPGLSHKRMGTPPVWETHRLAFSTCGTFLEQAVMYLPKLIGSDPNPRAIVITSVSIGSSNMVSRGHICYNAMPWVG